MENVKTQKNLEQIEMLQRQVGELQPEINRLQTEVVEIDHLRNEEGRWTQEKADLFLQIHKLKKDVRIHEDEIHELKGKIAHREAEWANTFESLKNYITKSYVVGFEAAME